jgi:hypothetical protein
MPAGFTRAEKNAADFGDEFTAIGVVCGNTTLTTAQVAATIAHGLGAAATFVLFSSTDEVAVDTITWASTATTLTFTSTNTAAPDTISYLAAILN